MLSETQNPIAPPFHHSAFFFFAAPGIADVTIAIAASAAIAARNSETVRQKFRREISDRDLMKNLTVIRRFGGPPD
jgi:hypothetical protein